MFFTKCFSIFFKYIYIQYVYIGKVLFLNLLVQSGFFEEEDHHFIYIADIINPFGMV